MSLDDIRDRSRAAIHEQFSLPATAISADGAIQVDGLTVRMHIDLNRAFGDLDREGFAKRYEFDNVLIFDTCQWMPQEMYIVDFGRNRKFKIKNIIDGSGHRYVRAEVTEVE